MMDSEYIKDGVIDMEALSKHSGKSEFELAKTILTVLAIKADVTGITQHVRMSVKKGDK